MYFNDHGPEHIHALKDNSEAKIDLDDCECYYARGFNAKTIKELEKFVRNNKKFLLETWRDFHK